MGDLEYLSNLMSMAMDTDKIAASVERLAKKRKRTELYIISEHNVFGPRGFSYRPKHDDTQLDRVAWFTRQGGEIKMIQSNGNIYVTLPLEDE